MSALDDRLLPIFVRQHWLVSVDDVIRSGGSTAAITHRLRVGRWERVDNGVYRLVGATQTWEARVLAPILGIEAPAAASHMTAAVLHGIPGFGEGTPEITVPRGRDSRRAGLRVHSSTDFDRCAIVERRGIPTTDVARTLLDVARTVGDRRLHRSIEWCRRKGLTDWSTLISTLARHSRRGRPGVRRLRRVILAHAGREEVTDSDFELLVLASLAEAGLPEPVLHHRVMDGGRFVAEVDLAFPQWRIAIELDGAVHLEPEVRERDLPRQNDLVLLGWTVLRFSWRRFADHPDRVMAEIAAAITAAACG